MHLKKENEWKNKTNHIEDGYHIPNSIDEIYNEMKMENQKLATSSEPSVEWFGNYALRVIDEMESIFEPNEILAILPHSTYYYFTKNYKGFGNKLAVSLAVNDLKQFKIKNLKGFFETVCSIPDEIHIRFANILCESKTPHQFYDYFISDNQIPVDIDNATDNFVSTNNIIASLHLMRR